MELNWRTRTEYDRKQTRRSREWTTVRYRNKSSTTTSRIAKKFPPHRKKKQRKKFAKPPAMNQNACTLTKNVSINSTNFNILCAKTVDICPLVNMRELHFSTWIGCLFNPENELGVVGISKSVVVTRWILEQYGDMEIMHWIDMSRIPSKEQTDFDYRLPCPK